LYWIVSTASLVNWLLGIAWAGADQRGEVADALDIVARQQPSAEGVETQPLAAWPWLEGP
jgi:hypothetical protein